MVDHAGDLLGVTFEYGHNLLRVLVEHGRVAIVASGQQLAVVRRIDVQGEDAGHAGRVETLECCSGYYTSSFVEVCVAVDS